MMSVETMFQSVAQEGRLVDRVASEIQRLIVDGQLQAGVRLPSEMELAAQLAVSRTVIREAVHTLMAKGLLETRPGVGTTVREVTRDQVVEPLGHLLRVHNASLDHLYQVRAILEVEIAALAATQATPDDISELRQIMAGMESASDNPERVAASDAEFHRWLAQITRNPLLIILLDSIRDLMQEVRLRVSTYPDVVQTIIPDHRLILECVIANDAAGARSAMRNHVEHARTIQQSVFAPPPGEDRGLSQSGNHKNF
jgi:GntR family transcriptional regulator, transcriptional repressor for pyruvate dehydrogenase complex